MTFTPNDRRDIAIQINGAVTTAFTIDDNGVIVFATAPANNASIVAFEDFIFIKETTAKFNAYLADDVAIEDQSFHTFPVNQRNQNVEIRVYSDSPFPISLSSMVWEGQYSPRFIRRA